MVHKSPMTPSKIFAIIIAIWLCINIIVLFLWKKNFITMQELKFGLVIINAQPLATLIIKLFNRKRSFNMDRYSNGKES